MVSHYLVHTLHNQQNFHITSIHLSVGMPSPILITALHLVNLAPIDAYSFNLSSKPSKPTVTVSPGQSSIGSPLSTLMPGSAPCSDIRSLNKEPSAEIVE